MIVQTTGKKSASGKTPIVVFHALLVSNSTMVFFSRPYLTVRRTSSINTFSQIGGSIKQNKIRRQNMVYGVYSAELNSLGVDKSTHQGGYPTTWRVPNDCTVQRKVTRSSHRLRQHIPLGKHQTKFTGHTGTKLARTMKVITYKGITRCKDSPRSSQLPIRMTLGLYRRKTDKWTGVSIHFTSTAGG